ncbi:MAG TPA: rod shape-determining protein RodA [Candidatus Hydrogenedentes bacterium]|nr:rod shape-determining protein RodA [Candidatus Hydrogenedentota bacterium]
MFARNAEFTVHDVTIRPFNPRNLLRIDWLLPIFILLLAGAGWLTMYSASRSSDIMFFYKQIIFFFLGLSIALIIICIDYRFLVSLAPLMYAVMLALLVAVLLWGVEIKGGKRWLRFGFVGIQPSELAKIIMIYSLTWYFTTIGGRIRKLPWFVLTFIITSIPMLLILKQPNLGTAGCLIPLLFVMLYVAGCRLWHLLAVILIGLSVIPVVWWQIKDFDPKVKTEKQAFYELEYYQKLRIYTFLNPGTDKRDSGWQTDQSKITIGSGGMSGKGYLKGTQTRLNYVPEHHTDFIFSLLAEEHGFVGAAVLAGLFCAFLLRGLMYARDCPEMMGTLLASGVVTVLAFHIFVNIAITIGLMPVTGIPLPFLSYGGSFYMTTMACVGILLNVPMRRGMFVNYTR